MDKKEESLGKEGPSGPQLSKSKPKISDSSASGFVNDSRLTVASVAESEIVIPIEDTDDDIESVQLSLTEFEVEDEDALDDELEEQEWLRKQEEIEMEARRTKLREIRRRKWRAKKCVLLSMFIVAFFIGSLCLIKWVMMFDVYHYPPTEFAEDSTTGAVFAFTGLLLISIFGFVILSFQISNIFVGMIFMFNVILVIGFSLLCVSRGVSSQMLDTAASTMKIYLRAYSKTIAEGADPIPLFYDKVQNVCECCGFDEIDRMKDWPVQLDQEDDPTQKMNFPKSCCVSTNPSVDCKELGRMHKESFRVPGGFTIYHDKYVMELWLLSDVQSFLPKDNYQFDQYMYNISEKLEQTDFMPRTLSFFVNELLKNPNVNQTMIELFFKNRTTDKVLAAPALPLEVEMKLDSLVEELIYAKKMERGKWAFFELPLLPREYIKVHAAPFLPTPGSVNPVTRSDRFTATPSTTLATSTTPCPAPPCPTNPPITTPIPLPTIPVIPYQTLSAFYVTAGIPENIQMEGLVRHQRCDRDVSGEKELGFGIVNMNKCGGFKTSSKYDRFSDTIDKYPDWEFGRTNQTPKEVDADSLSRTIVRDLMLWNIGMGSVVTVVMLMLALIFWYFYSRLKAEEQADLKLPTDFDLLHLDQFEGAELDDAAKELEEELLKLKMMQLRDKELQEQAKERHMHHEYKVVPVSYFGNPIVKKNLPEEKKIVKLAEVNPLVQQHDVEDVLMIQARNIVNANKAVYEAAKFKRQTMAARRPPPPPLEPAPTPKKDKAPLDEDNKKDPSKKDKAPLVKKRSDDVATDNKNAPTPKKDNAPLVKKRSDESAAATDNKNAPSKKDKPHDHEPKKLESQESVKHHKKRDSHESEHKHHKKHKK